MFIYIVLKMGKNKFLGGFCKKNVKYINYQIIEYNDLKFFL